MTSQAFSNTSLETLLRDAEQRYIAANPNSQQSYQQACTAMPGGNTRTALFYPPFPLTIDKAEGSQLWDVDGHCYTDFLGEYSAGIYGHSHPRIQQAVRETMEKGIVYGGPSAYEAKLAALLSERYPSCELLRFCNSGTEANLMAISAARLVTGKTHILVFKGGYHGGVLSYLPVPAITNAPYPTIMADYNDLAGTVALIEQHADELAAVLMEPMMGTAGCLPAEPEFLHGIRKATEEHGVMLILDEVMTSRLSPGGLQQKLGIKPDLTSLGKYLGGGLTFGAFGGRADIMERFDPRRPDAFLHSGTYNNNVLTMTAGYVALNEIYTPEAADQLNNTGDSFRQRLNQLARQHKVPAQVTGVGSLMGMHFTDQPIRSPKDASATPDEARSLFHLHMLSQGFYIGRKGYMSLSLALEEADYDRFAEAFEEFLSTHGAALQGSRHPLESPVS